MKYASLIIGILIILLVVAGAVLLWQRGGETGPTPIEPTTPTEPTDPTEPITPQEPDAFIPKNVKNFTEAEKDCKNEQCKKILTELRKFVEAPLVGTNDWVVYENMEERFKFKYPKDWVRVDSKNDSLIGLALFSPQIYSDFRKEGATDGPPGLHFNLIKDTPSLYPDGTLVSLGPYIYTLPSGQKALILHRIGIREGSVEIFLYGKENIYEFVISFFPPSEDREIIKTIINSLEFQD